MTALDVISLFNEISPFATLALLVYLVLQGRNAHVEREDVLKLELVKLVAAAVANIEESTKAIKLLHGAEKETQTLIMGTRRVLETHHSASVERFDELHSAIQAVPARTDEKLAPRFEALQQLLAAANSMVEDIATDVKARAQRIVSSAAPKEDCAHGLDAVTSPDGAGEKKTDESAAAQKQEEGDRE